MSSSPIIVLLVASVLAACGGAKRNAENLSDTIRVYNEGVRWSRFSAAAAALPPAQRGAFVDEMDQRAKDLRISDYELVRVDTPSAKEARVHVKISWYLDSVQTLRETHAVQSWELHGKAWWMVDEVRLRGDEMPGVSEPVEATAEASQPDGALAEPAPSP